MRRFQTEDVFCERQKGVKNLTPHLPFPCKHRALFYVLGLSVVVLSALAQGAPISLQYKTTVANTLGLPLGAIETIDPLPFAVSPGDPLTVTFTYEPWSGPGTYVQSGVLSAAIGSETLVTPFQIVVRDDVFGLIDTPGRIVGTAPSVDAVAFYVDQTTLTCPGGVGAYCGSVVGHDEFKFTSQLVFEDRDLQTLALNDPSSGSNFWNAFDMREIRIAFNNGAFIGAYIPPLADVPERVGSLAPAVALSLLFWPRVRLA